MITINERFLQMPRSYLFADVANRVSAFKQQIDKNDIISLGIGDVTRPICIAASDAMHKAVDDLSQSYTFRGYGPEQGYEFLREAIVEYDYATRGIELRADEVFISDGAKSDTGNISDILGLGNRVAVTDPVYPVYVDSNAMAGRAGSFVENKWDNLEYLPCTAENSFVPALPKRHVDMIYLCYPNNPTGTVLSKKQLKKWVDYALKHKALILFDAAYEAYITDPEIPHSIYEIEGAKKVAIEFRSYSKTAGFTGVRCSYTVIPDELIVTTSHGEEVQLNTLWLRRQCTKFNGASYVAQRAAEATYTELGRRQVCENIQYYLHNAAFLKKALEDIGLVVYGGENSPYLWTKTPHGMTSWEFFDVLLQQAHIVATPGVGFGPSGEGYVRFTAFGKSKSYQTVAERLMKITL